MENENDVKQTMATTTETDTDVETETETTRTFLSWVKAHWKELAIAGLSVGMIVLLVLLVKDRRTIRGLESALDKALHDPVKIPEAKKIIEDLSKNSKKITHTAHLVHEHVRNLPEGMHPSSEKVIEAVRKGIHLDPGQTWVAEYFTRSAA